MENECPFCRMVAGSVDTPLIFQDDVSLAFLDRRPLFPGHTLLIPRLHVETLTDLPEELVGPLFATARMLAAAVQVGCNSEGTFVAMNNRVSQSVPHLHIHIVPRRKKDGLKGFFWPRQKYGEGEMDDVARRIRQALGSQG